VARRNAHEKDESAVVMFKYLNKRRCPKCYYDFVVVLVDCSARMRRINGFCGRCDHYLDWQLFRSKSSQRSNDVGIDGLSQSEFHRTGARLSATRKAALQRQNS
jgi:hypothetical protein